MKNVPTTIEIAPQELDASMSDRSAQAVSDAKISEYQVFLHEHYRSRSKGGNAKALHIHLLTIDDTKYSFFAPGWTQWVHKTDRISFQWRFDQSGKYRNIDRLTIKVFDKEGKPTKRGSRDFSKKRRTAPYKLDNAMRHSPMSFDRDKLMGNE
jgi:hypothetical protein